MEALSVAGVRRLVALYRTDVDGAADEINQLIESRAGDLTALLDVPGVDVEVLRSDDHRVELFAQWVENAARHHHERRQRRARKQAELALDGLVRTARRLDAAMIELDPAALDELVACAGYDWLAFDTDFPVRGIPRSLLRAFLRECRDVEVHHATLHRDMLVLTYAGARSRGVLRLAWQHVPQRATALPVRFPRAQSVAPRAEPARHDDSTGERAPSQPSPDITQRVTGAPDDRIESARGRTPPGHPRGSSVPTPTPPRRSTRRSPPGFLGRLIEALTEGG